MEDGKRVDVSQFSHEMLSFTLTHFESSNSASRLGRLLFAGRKPIKTPHYVPTASRGVVPHLTHDVVQKHTAISGTYLALEDFIEKSTQNAPIFKSPAVPNQSPLRTYTALHDDFLSILGPRRVPAVPCPAHNTNSAISVSTSVGFRQLENKDYIDALHILQPDLAVSLADIITAEKYSAKRVPKSADRTHAWLRDTLEALISKSTAMPPIFAVVPPIDKEQQSFYLSDLVHELRPHISGLTIYDPSSVDSIPKDLSNLPRLCLSTPSSPHAILTAVELGVDIITTPFVSMCSEHGIALSFAFPGPGETKMPLGFDLWSPSYATDISSLSVECECYTCRRHHRAYVHHLLQAKEMLAWTLLQIHNHAIMDRFFSAIRRSIELGQLEDDTGKFSSNYDFQLPERTGEGPRIRGYQMKSVGRGEPRKNSKAYGTLDDTVERMAESKSGIAIPTGDAEELQEHGFAAKADDT